MGRPGRGRKIYNAPRRKLGLPPRKGGKYIEFSKSLDASRREFFTTIYGSLIICGLGGGKVMGGGGREIGRPGRKLLDTSSRGGGKF